VPRRNVVPASILAMLAAGCATTDGPQVERPGRSLTRGKPTSGYEVHEAAEAGDTDDLQISLQHGFIKQEAAQEALARRLPELTRCYERAGAAMGFAGGQVTLRFEVNARGETSDVRVTESRLGNFEVESCLLGVGRTVRFPRPKGNAAATVEYPLEFRSTGDIAVMEVGTAALEPQLPALYARIASACAPLGAAEVSATFYVDAAGNVRSAGLASDEDLDAEAAGCVAAALRRWNVRLSEVQGGVGRVTVPLRSVDLVARREPSPEVRRYSRASATARARRRPAR
jgi:TonB family protein